MNKQKKTQHKRKRTAIVTGGSGFCGYHLCKRLGEQGWRVLWAGNPKEGNIPQGEYLCPWFQKIPWKDLPAIDALFHLGAITDPQSTDIDALREVNLEQPIRLFKRALHHSWATIVYASSAAVYGNASLPTTENDVLRPLTPYAHSKAALDDAAGSMAAKSGATIISLRLSNVFGLHEEHKGSAASMVTQLYNQMQVGNPRLFEHGEQSRDWVHVDDVCQAFLLAAEHDKADVFNIGSGQTVSFNDIVRVLNVYMGCPERIPHYIPNPYHATYQNHTWLDIGKARRQLEYTPFSAQPREALEFYVAQRKLHAETKGKK